MSFVFKERDTMRIDEVALFFSTSRRTVERWLSLNKLPFVRLPSGRREIPRAAVFGATANAA